MKKLRANILCASATVLASCMSPADGAKANVEELVSAAPDQIAGFAMDPAASRFRLGDGVRSDRLNGFDRIVGQEGVIARGLHGQLLSVANAGAHSTKVSFSRNAKAHGELTRSYFVAAGIPEAQIGIVQTNGYAAAQDRAEDLFKTGTPTVVQRGFYSVLERKVGAYRVSGSYAWARFNDEGDVVSEEVFWPELPAGLTAAAGTLASARADVISRVPLELRSRGADTEVVIHHSPATQPNLESFATLDFPGIGEAAERRFDISGAERRFESERSVGPVGEPRKPGN